MKSPLIIPTSPLHHTMSKYETSTKATTPSHTNMINSHKRRAKTPSFSSILLDSIYRSIDDTDSSSDHLLTATTSNIVQNDRNNNDHDYTQASKQRRTKMRSDSTLETIDLRHAIMIESWMEKQPSQPQPQPQPQTQNKPYYYHTYNDVDHHNVRIVRQKSVPSRSRATSCNSSNTNFASTSTSSSTSSSCFMPSKIRTNLAPRSTDSCLHAPKPSSTRDREPSSRIFNKTKSRALKIYSDLKKSKQQQQPISPGARIAAFLNSIFRNAGNTAPARSSPSSMTTPGTASTSTCSSASSFSRSCLSKTTNTTSSTEKSKRSVRFYPLSVIVDEDSQPCGEKSLYKKDQSSFLYNDVDDQKLPVSSIAKPAASDHQQRKWKREKEIDALMSMIKKNCGRIGGDQQEVLCFESDSGEEMDVDDDEDGESCASSDLFELENLSSIGVSRFSQELPVYGTTSLKNLTV